MRVGVVLLAALIGLGCSFPADKREITELKRQNTELQQKNSELRQKLEGIEMQEKCIKLAERSFASIPKERGTNYDYICHYNKKLNKFFISTSSFTFKSMITMKFIVDLLENKTIAAYGWKPDKVKKYWEVKPFYCNVYDEPKDWTTDEYNAFEKSCMTD